MSRVIALHQILPMTAALALHPRPMLRQRATVALAKPWMPLHPHHELGSAAAARADVNAIARETEADPDWIGVSVTAPLEQELGLLGWFGFNHLNPSTP